MCLVVLLPSRISNRFSLGLTLLVIGIGLPNSLHFLVYFVSELSRNSDSTLLLLGTIIGLGISISIAILLNILLTHFVSMRATYFLQPRLWQLKPLISHYYWNKLTHSHRQGSYGIAAQ